MREYLQSLIGAAWEHPALFWAIPPIILVILISGWLRTRLLAATILRALSAALILLALAQPLEIETSSSEELPVLFDVSASISQRAKIELINRLEVFREKAERELLIFPFGAAISEKPIRVLPKTSSAELAELMSAAAENVDLGETDIESSLLSLLTRSGSSSLLLLSDGQETEGRAAAAASYAGKKGLAVYPLLGGEEAFLRERIYISALDAPISAKAGEKEKIRISVKNSKNEPARGRLELFLEEEKLLSRTIELEPGRESLVVLDSPLLKGGLKRIRAVVRSEEEGGGEGSSLDETHKWISVKEKAKLLLISGNESDARVINRLIQALGFGLEAIVADGKREIPLDLDNYSSIILNNAAKVQLRQGFLEQLERFVSSGGGLLILGGDRSFGLGGYINTPLEEVSPLKFVPPQTKKRRLSSAVILVIDKSGSMIHQNKIDAAKQAALMSIESLRDGDFVSVIGFDDAPFVIIDLKPVSEVRSQAERRLRNLTAAGQTNLLPALAAARQKLRAAKAGRKHIIVLSDGKFPLASDAYVGEINRLRDEGVSVSAVALGLEADVPFMKLLAKYGKGAFYHTLDPSRLPSIFVHDIKVSTGEQTMKEQDIFTVQLGPAGIVSSTVGRYPPLKGFVETLPKKGCSLELITGKEEKYHPVLASWNRGLGRVVAFTSDLNGRWSEPWLRWPDFPTFWRQVLESIKNRSGKKGSEIDFDLRYYVERKEVVLDLAIFDETLRVKSAPAIKAKVTEPGGELRNVIFEQAAKGRFRALLPNVRPGDYKLEVHYGLLRLPPLALTLEASSFGEVEGGGLNIPLLEQIAHLSGGMINPEAEQVVVRKRMIEKSKPLFVPLVLAAFFLVILEALVREAGSWLISWIGLGYRKSRAPARQLRGYYR